MIPERVHAFAINAINNAIIIPLYFSPPRLIERRNNMRSLGLDAIPVGMLFANTPFAVSSVAQIIAPSANLNGIIIRTLILAQNGGSAGVTGTVIYADTVAPSTYNDATKRTIFASSVNPNSTVTTFMPNPIYLYPGLGLWVGSGVASSGFVYVTYDLLAPEGR